ncbi:MAG: MarR family winged helix-turn-helix transcriptional regulator [Armatimonadota bacterium]|jgi:DNA-binding MarR family transcriptional regulator
MMVDSQNDSNLRKKSEEVVSVLLALMRHLNTLAADDIAMELPGAQLRVCGLLWDGPKTMSTLAEELDITHSAITQIADRLERAEMVERVLEEDDRRCKRLALTAKGLAVLEGRRERRILRTMEAMKLLSGQQQDCIVESLRTMLNASRKIS